MDIAIAIVTYNRPDSLRRLLDSISKASVGTATLYISIDGNGDTLTMQLAEQFAWPHGEKQIISHPTNLGLRNHVITCTDLVDNHNGIIIIEDDLFVNQSFYKYSKNALSFYSDDAKIAGISLYSHIFNETAEMPFMPLNDGNDVFFMQLPSSWGQCFTREQWTRFKLWYENNKRLSRKQLNRLPQNVAKWPESSWKKFFVCYMIENDLYFVYPRDAHCTNFADKGVNLNNDDYFQVPLNFGKNNMSFSSFSGSGAKYDSYCEITPSNLNLHINTFLDYNYTIDLYGNKPISQISTDYVLTSRQCSNPIHSYARKMIPHEANIIAGIAGNEIFFSHIRDINSKKQAYSTNRVVYFHRLPSWHLKEKRLENDKPAHLNEKEETLLRIYSNKVGKLLFKPVFLIYRLFISLRNYLQTINEKFWSYKP